MSNMSTAISECSFSLVSNLLCKTVAKFAEEGKVFEINNWTKSLKGQGHDAVCGQNCTVLYMNEFVCSYFSSTNRCLFRSVKVSMTVASQAKYFQLSPGASVQYVRCVMQKCIIVKVGENEKHRKHAHVKIRKFYLQN